MPKKRKITSYLLCVVAHDEEGAVDAILALANPRLDSTAGPICEARWNAGEACIIRWSNKPPRPFTPPGCVRSWGHCIRCGHYFQCARAHVTRCADCIALTHAVSQADGDGLHA